MLTDGELSIISTSSSELHTSMNWLNRLRAAKGFPVDPELSIDDFLTSQGLSEETRSFILSSQNENGALADTCKEPDNRFRRFAESYNSQTIIFDIPSQVPCLQSDSNNNKASDSDIAHSKDASGHWTLLSCKHLQPVLSNIQSNSNPSSAPQQIKVAGTENCIQPSVCKDATQMYFDMLSELFCMETCNSNLDTTKKRLRKQEKPKNCNTSSDLEPSSTVITSTEVHTSESNKNTCQEIVMKNPPARNSEAALLEKKGNHVFPSQSLTKWKPPGHQKALKKVNIDSNKRKDDAVNDMTTGNDIFVIDTSLPGWSVEKLIRRKGNSWRVQTKEPSISMEESSKKPMKVPKKKSRTTEDGDALELKRACKMQLQLQCDSWGSSKEQCHKDNLEPLTVDQTWNTMLQTQMRSQRKPRKNAVIEDESASGYQSFFNSDTREQSNTLAPDHPANQPKEGLVYSIYKVFMQAGRSGLTAREAVSRILDQGLPGLHEGGVAPRVEVLKIISNSPYFMPLEESKYILCSALVGDEENPNAVKQDLVQLSITKIDEDQTKAALPESSNASKLQSDSQYWAAYAASAIQRARIGKNNRKHTLSPSFVNSSINDEVQDGKGSLQKKRLKSMKQDTTGLGNQCNRSDGKGWHCPLRAKIGYLLCDHHLDRLRTRVKTHIKSKMLCKEDRKRIMGGSWMVKKVVERSRIGRHVPVALNQHRKLSSEGMFDHEVNI